MKQQVDKLIANTLLIEGEVYLPEVGTLILCRQTAKLLSTKQLQGPHRELRLTREKRGVSILSYIMHVANVSEIRANDIYAEWLAQSLRDGVLTIGLVCTIEGGKITTDEVFDGVANPDGNNIIKIKPRKNVAARVAVAIFAIAALGGAGFYLYTSGVVDPILAKLQSTTTAEVKVEQVVAPETTEAAPIVNEADSTAVVIDEAKVDSTLIATTEPATEQVVESSTEQPTQEAPVVEQAETPAAAKSEILPLRSTYSYAVWGVYRELKNAEEAITWLGEKYPEVDAHIYKYGARYMVAVYEAKSRTTCGRKVSKWKAQRKSFRSVWVYTR